MSTLRAFTLFEVLISMLVMSVAVLAVAGILPSGIQAQEQARYQIYASALALELMHRQANDSTTWYTHLYAENQAMGASGEANRNGTNAILANPLELSFRSLKPLPSALAGRIDSDGDEIAEILAAGGQIYYADGQMLQAENRDRAREEPGEAIGYKMLCAVLGEPQNGLIRHPEIAWPYRDAIVAPPVERVDAFYDPDVRDAFGSGHRYATSPGVRDNPQPSTVEVVPDADPYKKDHWDNAGFRIGSFAGDGWHQADFLTLGAFDFWRKNDGYPRATASEELLEAELALTGLAAAWYYADELKGIDLLVDGPADPDDPSYVPTADEVRAFRFAAYFAMRLTSGLFVRGPEQFMVFESGGTKGRIDLESGSLTLEMWKEGEAWNPTVTLDVDDVARLREKAIRCAMNFQSRFPYRWDVTRPQERSLAWDHPLLQYDVVPDASHPYLAADIPRWPILSPVRMPAAVAASDPVTGGQVLAAYGRSHTSANRAEIDRSWSGGTGPLPARMTVTRPWAAADRCRQLVFWVADWQSYRDFEDLPPEPLDSSRYPFTSDGNLAAVTRHPFLLPEGDHLWASAAHDLEPKYRWSKLMDNNKNWRNQFSSSADRAAFWGAHGADRNGNRRYDRGELPPTTRIRATTVARFNFYESIGPASITN